MPAPANAPRSMTPAATPCAPNTGIRRGAAALFKSVPVPEAALDVPVLVPPPLRESSVAVLVAPEPEDGRVVKLSGSESERLGMDVSVSDTVAELDVTVRVSVSDEEVVRSVVVAPEDTETSVVTELLAVMRVSVAADEVRTACRQ